jgi:hypothetical protein
VATVHKLARSCPGFWESDALLRSCQSGEWLGLDRDAVAKVGVGPAVGCRAGTANMCVCHASKVLRGWYDYIPAAL